MPRPNTEEGKKRNAEYFKKWYKENKEKQYKRVKDRQKALIEWFKEYKSEKKCEECGYDHPAALVFHHIDPNEKEDMIGKIVAKGRSKKRILEEIKKCKVLCANCHRVLHYNLRMGV